MIMGDSIGWKEKFLNRGGTVESKVLEILEIYLTIHV